MASTVNSLIADSVVLVNRVVLGNAPALATATLYQATAQAMGNAAHNNTMAQQQGIILAQAGTAQGASLIYSIIL